MLDYLKQIGIIEEDGNLIKAEKAFKVHSFAKWIDKTFKEGKINRAKAQSLYGIIDRYINDEIALVWKDGDPYLKELKPRELE